MGIQILEEMINLVKDIGEIKAINMYDENSIYIEGDTNDGKKFNFNLRIEEKENA